jgi:hypothetical protein
VEPVPSAAVAVAAPVSVRAVALAALAAGELVLDAVELGAPGRTAASRCAAAAGW